jgi:4-amino-4-deoxy-L-arabinose transferase
MSGAVFKSIENFLERYDKYLLFILSLVFNCVYIIQTPYLFDWDEKFHALVAKNLSADWRIPILITDTIVQPCKDSWVCCGVWLHKQPVFLYQMALSIKIFGVNEFAVRFPSALMVSLLIFPVYRIAEIIKDKTAAIIAAFFSVTNATILSHMDGFSGMDHNDIAFMFYVTLSVWALVEYIQSDRKMFLLFLAVFSGIAVLNKWLTGLLGIQGLFIFLIFFSKKSFREIIVTLFYVGIISAAVFLPWQLYVYLIEPEIAIHEWQMNQRHFFEVVEGHSFDAMFYINNLPLQYSYLHYFLIAIPLCLFLFKEQRKYLIPLFVMIISVYVFFTIAATKVAGYTLVVMPIAYVFFGLLISFLYKQIQAKLSISILPLLIAMVALLIFQNLNFSRIKLDHDISGSDWRSLRYSSKKANAALYKRLALDYKDDKIAIIGFEHFDQIDCLFYTDANCYANGLRDEEIAKLRKNGYDIGVFRNYIPKNLIEDSSVVILPYDYSH